MTNRDETRIFEKIARGVAGFLFFIYLFRVPVERQYVKSRLVKFILRSNITQEVLKLFDDSQLKMAVGVMIK